MEYALTLSMRTLACATADTLILSAPLRLTNAFLDRVFMEIATTKYFHIHAIAMTATQTQIVQRRSMNATLSRALLHNIALMA